ncbi:MAG: S41 family peptidase [Myxococcota bacterium]
MTPSALTLLLTTSLLVALTVLSVLPRVRVVLWAATFILVGWQILSEPRTISMLSVYLLVAVMALAALLAKFLGSRTDRKPANRRWPRVLLALFALPLLAVPVIEAFVIPFDPEDYGRDGWTEAYDKLHATLERRYAFGRWKAIDWEQLRARHRPSIVAAEQAGDEAALYLALRAYVYDLHDGHVSIRSDLHQKLQDASIGGGVGMALLQLDDGRVIVHILEEDGPAARAGVRWGAEVLEWNHQPIGQAIAAVPTLWTSRPIATTDNLALARQRLLTRSPGGTEVQVTFRNRGEDMPRTVSLVARDDGYDIYWRSVAADPRAPAEDPVSFEMVGPGIGYIRIASLESSAAGMDPPEAMDVAMRELLAQGMRGLILDVRGNRGGMDRFVPEMMGYFTRAPIHYEGITAYNQLLGRFTELTSLQIEPKAVQFGGPVVVLIDHRTKSSGEGFALIAKSSPQVDVMGLHPTDGSFGMAEATVYMPRGIEVGFPWGQSVDAFGVVQVEGNQALEGGVDPDIDVPMTYDIATAAYEAGHDVVLESAVSELRRTISE